MAKDHTTKIINRGAPGGLFLATYIGAATYFVQHAQGFWGVIWGLIQAAFWPAFVVYQVLSHFHVTSL